MVPSVATYQLVALTGRGWGSGPGPTVKVVAWVGLDMDSQGVGTNFIRPQGRRKRPRPQTEQTGPHAAECGVVEVTEGGEPSPVGRLSPEILLLGLVGIAYAWSKYRR